MSYKALYRKYRPQTFEDVLGQDHIISTFINIIKNEKIAHAYLFSGPRGTGKTSVAHIFAKEINRNAAGNVQANSLDIIELDAASNNGVAEIRNLIDNARYATTSAQYKVYIIDEAHMLTKGAFNAFLKTLEEPPKHVVFILATTEPDKLPITILSRVQRFNFRRITPKIIESQLKKILADEKITYNSEQVIKLIAQLARGGLRDALSIADQAAAYGNSQITLKVLADIFGITDITKQIQILTFAYEGASQKLLLLINKLIADGIDIEQLTMALINILKDWIILQKTNDFNLLENLGQEDIGKLNISLNFAYQSLDILMKLLSDLRFSQMPQQSFMLALLQLLQKPQPSFSESVIDTADLPPVNILSPENVSIKKTIPNVKKTTQEKANKDKLISTDELHLTQNMILKNQEEDSTNEEIAEEILSTQDIPNDELAMHGITTDEIDLVSMFANEEQDVFNKNSNEKVKTYDEMTIINLLMQAKKNQASEAKRKLASASLQIKDVNTNLYASLLSQASLIAKGNNFLLLTIKDPSQLAQLQDYKSTQEFIDFVNIIFEEPLQVFVISLAQFDKVKVRYKELARQNALPKAMPIEPPSISAQVQSEAEVFGENLFGKIFKK